MFIHGEFTRDEAVAACEDRGSLARADDLDTFRVLWGMLHDSRTPYDDVNRTGAWLDGKLDANGTWQCESNKTECGPSMPWSAGEPDLLQRQKCVMLWLPRGDGVTNYFCAHWAAAICDAT